MDSPAKRRRKNGYAPSDQAVRGLEYFFARQQDAAKSTRTSNLDAESGHDRLNDRPIVLDDEDLARRLQTQWDEEAKQAVPGRGQNLNLTIAPTGSPNETFKNDTGHEGSTMTEINESDGDKLIVKGEQKTLSLQSTSSDEDTVASSIPFDENPLAFDPGKYTPDLMKHWSSDGSRATYALLTRCFVLVNSTTSRIKIVDTLVNLLRTIIESDPVSVLPAVRKNLLAMKRGSD